MQVQSCPKPHLALRVTFGNHDGSTCQELDTKAGERAGQDGKRAEPRTVAEVRSLMQLQLESTHDKAVFGLFLLKVVQEAAQHGDGPAQDLLDDARQAYERRHDHE